VAFGRDFAPVLVRGADHRAEFLARAIWVGVKRTYARGQLCALVIVAIFRGAVCVARTGLRGDVWTPKALR